MGLLLLVAELEAIFWCLSAVSVGGVLVMALADRKQRAI
jgi:hypothetical protein